MQWENLFYALTQIIHNFGALAVVAGALVGWKTKLDQASLKLGMAKVVLTGWLVQGVSGLVFGGISLLYYGETPDLHAVAAFALTTKMFCAVSGVLLAIGYIKNNAKWDDRIQRRVWMGLVGLGVTALIAAAFLRWFS